jgi:uncharacterized protein YecT (DUF1311 family)
MINTARRFILLLALTALASACATSPEEQARRDGERCAAGHQPQSKSYEDCLSRVASDRDARLQQRHRELVERPPSYGR